jgi:hypothetical protein
MTTQKPKTTWQGEKLEVGNIITVFEDPLTEKKAEGKAKLIKLLKDDSETRALQYWEVESLGEKYLRWIRVKQDPEEVRKSINKSVVEIHKKHGDSWRL